MKMNKKVKRYVKIAVTVLIIGLFVWFLVIYPLVSFKGYEKTMKEAAERYFVIKPGELPTGERIKTISLQDLFFGAYIKEDFYVPYTKEPCSLKDSWVKVRKENNEYKYYTYLKCGVLSSNVDHKGPTLTLNGDETITVTKGSEFKDPGVKSVVDNKDGEIDKKKVSVTGEVDTSKTGIYTLTYTVLDSLNNMTQVERKVEVVERLKSTIENVLGEKTGFTGNPDNNYIYFSNMLFRILDIDGENIRIVSSDDIANVNYEGIEDWLDEVFYKHLNNESKKLIVKNKYCNMTVADETTIPTECSSYTDNRKIYIPSMIDINKVANSNQSNFMKPSTFSWTATSKSAKEAYMVKDFFFGSDKKFSVIDKKYNFGVRPIITIKGSSLIKGGDGSIEDPYYLGDSNKGKANSLLNERESGEYIEVNGYIYRIMEVNSDGTTRVIADDTLRSNGLQVKTNYDDGVRIYNPKTQGNIGYFINNKTSDYIDASYFVNKKVKVPIYKEDPAYNKEIDSKTYEVKFSAPNTYDMYSAGGNINGSYWFINSSKDNELSNAISEIGVYLYGTTGMGSFGIRVVGNLKSDITIVSGDGTYESPYKISK